MAHKLDFSTGRAAFVSFAQPAWHGFGEVVKNALSAADALEKAALNFDVLKLPNVHCMPDGSEVVSTESFFTCRTDVNKVLGGRLGPDYTVLQNIEALSVADEILQSGTATIESAGALHGGARVFICLKVAADIIVGSTDAVKQFVVICNAHDGSMSTRVFFTNVRVVCQNTLSAALGQAKGNHAIRHTSGIAGRVAEAARTMRLIVDNTQINADNYGQMAQTVISKQTMFDYFGNIFLNDKEIAALQAGTRATEAISTRKRNILTGVLDFANRGTGQALAMKGAEFTTWAAYNAVTGYLSRQKFSSLDDRASGLLFGSAAEKIQAAGDLALAPAKIKRLSKIDLSSNLN